MVKYELKTALKALKMVLKNGMDFKTWFSLIWSNFCWAKMENSNFNSSLFDVYVVVFSGMLRTFSIYSRNGLAPNGNKPFFKSMMTI